MENQQQSIKQMTTNSNHHHFINQTFQTLSLQILTLPASHAVLTISTLITTMNSNNFSAITQNLNLVANTLKPLSTSSSLNKQITSHFSIKTSTTSSVASLLPKTLYFASNQTLFPHLLKMKDIIHFQSNNTSLQQIRFPKDIIKCKLQCIVCNKYNNKQDYRCKQARGEIISKKQFYLISFLEIH